MFYKPSCHHATHTLLLPEWGLYCTTIMSFISDTYQTLKEDGIFVFLLCARGWNALVRADLFKGGGGLQCVSDMWNMIEPNSSWMEPKVLIGMWLPVMSHHRDAGCFSMSVAVCKHMDPTDGNIVPPSPEQVTWRSASEVRVLRQNPPK